MKKRKPSAPSSIRPKARTAPSRRKSKSRVAPSPPELKPKKVGNRDKYYTHVHPRLNTILAWRRHGQTYEDIAKNLGVGLSSLHKYVANHGELVEVLKTGKDDAAAEVENAVFRTAIGYEYAETKITLEGTDNPKDFDVSPAEEARQIASGKRRIERFLKQQAPNTTAQIFYLSNRCSDRWRHKNSFEHSGPDGAPLAAGVVTFYLPEKKPTELSKGANAQ
jgi:hypothetical protein